MNKTLHKKLTENHYYDQSRAIAYTRGDNMLTDVMHEMIVLRGAAKDLLKPRPEAVANLLKMAREL